MKELLCRSCSRTIGVTGASVRLAGMFKPSLVGRFRPLHPQEIRRRCKHCGWVNLFVPLTSVARRDILDVKQGSA